MQLGAFSVSLAVKDLAASQAFYENLGFSQFTGHATQGYVILQNAGTTIGLFQGMFEGNMLTFNPGWNAKAQTLANFTDVREIQRSLKSKGVALMSEAGEATRGPASFMLTDPDGNVILVDQHV